MAFWVNASSSDVSGTGTRALVIDNDGNIAVGPTGPINPAYKFTVFGKIMAKEIRVDGAFAPDYVFEDTYKLLSLQEIEVFIKKNKHLPEVPSAVETERNGLELGEMNRILLKKIEELTLHLIEKDKKLTLAEKKSKELEARLARLEQLIK
jgi:hypothetical protein